MAEPFAETLETRRERSLVGRWWFAITRLARVVGHASTPATVSARSRSFRRPEAARTILTGPMRVKNRRARGGPKKQNQISTLFAPARARRGHFGERAGGW